MCLWPRGNRTTQWWCGWRVTVGTVGANWLSRARTITDYPLAGTCETRPTTRWLFSTIRGVADRAQATRRLRLDLDGMLLFDVFPRASRRQRRPTFSLV